MFILCLCSSLLLVWQQQHALNVDSSGMRLPQGGNFPSGAAQAAESAALKRQAMTAAAVLGLDATSQIPDVIAPAPSKPAAAAAAAPKPHQPSPAVHNHATLQTHSQSQATASSQGQALLQTPSQMPAHGKPQSLSQIMAQTHNPSPSCNPSPTLSPSLYPSASQWNSHRRTHRLSRQQFSQICLRCIMRMDRDIQPCPCMHSISSNC